MLNINKLYEKDKKELKTRIKDKLDLDWIQKQVQKTIDSADFFSDMDNILYNNIDILVPDRLGQNQSKYLLKLFDFEIDDQEYANNMYSYIEYIEHYFFQYMDSILQDNINIPDGFDILIYWDSAIYIQLTMQYDYIPNEIEEKLIVGTDVDLAISLAEYSSLFYLDDYYIFIDSNYCYDNNMIYYNSISFTDKKDIIDYIDDELDEAVINFLDWDRTKNSIIRELKHKNNKNLFFTDVLSLLSGIMNYYGSDSLKEVNSVYQIAVNELL